jgi:hypothetical protein
MALKFYCTRQLFVYADYINILGGMLHIIKKNAEFVVFVI